MGEFSASEAARFLLDRGLLLPGEILEGGLRVECAPGRNRNFSVHRVSGGSLFLKRGPGRGGGSLLPREAELHRRAASDSRFRLLGRHLPRLALFDARTDTLVVELIGEGVSLAGRLGPGAAFRRDLAEATGAVLGGLHRDLEPAAAGSGSLRDRLPWILDAAAAPPSPPRGGRTRAAELLAMLAVHPVLRAGCAEVRRRWRRETLLHGDVKSTNLVIQNEGGRGRRPGVRLVDWETAGIGDGTWDLGSAFHDYWVAETLAPRGRVPRGGKAALRALWKGYRRERGWKSQERERLLGGVLCGGARLLQTSFELARAAGDRGGSASALLQRSVDLFRRARRTAGEIAGPGGNP